jgi:hypothetical protein
MGRGLLNVRLSQTCLAEVRAQPKYKNKHCRTDRAEASTNSQITCGVGFVNSKRTKNGDSTDNDDEDDDEVHAPFPFCYSQEPRFTFEFVPQLRRSGVHELSHYLRSWFCNNQKGRQNGDGASDDDENHGKLYTLFLLVPRRSLVSPPNTIEKSDQP